MYEYKKAWEFHKYSIVNLKCGLLKFTSHVSLIFSYCSSATVKDDAPVSEKGDFFQQLHEGTIKIGQSME